MVDPDLLPGSTTSSATLLESERMFGDSAMVDHMFKQLCHVLCVSLSRVCPGRFVFPSRPSGPGPPEEALLSLVVLKGKRASTLQLSVLEMSKIRGFFFS